MDIYVYSDESGVFDREHNDIFVFGGVVFFDKEERDACTRKYIHAERTLRINNDEYQKQNFELKACKISIADRGKLFRSTSQYQRFGVVIDQPKLLERIFKSKKDKQRYLDFAYKIGLKRLLQHLINCGKIFSNGVENIFVFTDEHSTATNGKYELREALEQEFKYGTYNWDYSRHFAPIFESLQGLTLDFCNSEAKPLVRAADIIANRLYFIACNHPDQLNHCGIFVTRLP